MQLLNQPRFSRAVVFLRLYPPATPAAVPAFDRMASRSDKRINPKERTGGTSTPSAFTQRSADTVGAGGVEGLQPFV